MEENMTKRFEKNLQKFFRRYLGKSLSFGTILELKEILNKNLASFEVEYESRRLYNGRK